MQDICADTRGDLLIVDDVADNLRILSNTLLTHGYRVRAVRNGAMALVGARAVPPDLLLLDIRMPQMDGYEVCRQFKSDPQLCDIPIIFLSALDDAEDKAQAFAVGGVDYISKPFQTEEVLARVENQLTSQRLKKQIAAQNLFIGHNLDERSQALSAITTILDYSTRLCQNPAIDPEQYDALKEIQRNSQLLLNLVNT